MEKQLYKAAIMYNMPEHWIKYAEYKAKYGKLQDVILYYQKAGLNNNEISNLLVDIGNQHFKGDTEKRITKDYSIAFNYYKKAIEMDNNNIAACNIAIMYQNGLFVNKNITEAIKWYEQSINWGADYDKPYVTLGIIHYHGWNGVTNYIKAFNFFEKAANMGNAVALNYIGTIYYNGLYKPKDIEMAIRYYTKAIEKGDNKFAPINLGLIYYHELTYKDYTKAYSYFKIAEEDTDAMNMIAYMKAFARGTNHNLTEALYYINKALTLSPSIIRYWDTKGEILLMSDRVDDAKLILQEMVDKDSLEVEKLKSTSNFIKAIQYGSKEEIFLKLFELGDNLNSPYLLGNLYFQNKELIKAKTYYEIASKNGNDNAKVALYVIESIINNEQDVWKNSLINMWQYTPIITDSPIKEISFTSDGNNIIGNSKEGKVCYIWSSNGKELIYSHQYDQVYDGRAIFSPTGEYVIIEEGNNVTAQIWQVEKDTLLYSIDHFGGISRICFSNNGKFYLSYDKNGLDLYDRCALRLREIESGRIVFSKKLHHFVDYAGFSRDENYIIAIAGRLIYIWDYKTGDDVQIYDYKHSYNEMDKAVISPDNSKMICYKNKYHFVDIWSIKKRELINTLRHKAPINDACIDFNSQYLATASADSTAAIWDLSTGQKLITLNHKDVVRKLRFSPDSRILATVCSSNIQLWDVESGILLKSPMEHYSTICDFNFSPKGKTIISSTEEKVCRLWDVDTGLEITSPFVPADWIEYANINN